MPSGRTGDRQRPRRGEGPATRRSPPVRRATGGTGRNTGKQPGGQNRGQRPGRQNATRPRPKSGTGGAFRLSSTRRAAVLAILVCAMALSVSVPLRTYLSQRAELAATEQQRADLTRQVEQLRQRNAQLSDPAQVEAEARSRLGYVRPGETPYVVQVPPPAPAPAPPAPKIDSSPWYQTVWNSLTGQGM
jgi:cell division protein FtsB